MQYVSTKDGTRFGRIMQSVEKVYQNAQTRITTGVLNEILQDAIMTHQPPTHSGKRLKIKYITQVDVCPPTFAVFVNDPSLMHFSYERYLENCLRKAKDFSGTPIKLITKQSAKKEA